MRKKSLKVAMLIQSYLPRVGGAERQLAALAPLLAEKGVAIHIFTRRYPGMRPFDHVDGIPVHRTPTLRASGPVKKAADALFYSLLTLPRLRRLQPDLLHSHELLSPTTTALLARHLWDVPVVAKVLRGGELGDVEKLRSRRGGGLRLRAMRRSVSAFIAISGEIERELATLGVPANRRVFIPNGVDTCRFAPPSPAEKRQARHILGLADAPSLIYTGRLVPEKQVDRLLDAWHAVHAAHPAATLLIVGGGPEETRLRAMAGDGVHFAGQVANVAPWLRAADIFVLPSATEGLSNALLEGMAAGLAPVATAVGGAPDVITAGENGLLVTPGDVNGVASALNALLSDPEQRGRVAAAARTRVADGYSLESVTARLRTLYDRVLDTPSGK